MSRPETKFEVISPREANEKFKYKMNDKGLISDDDLFHDGKYKFFSPYMGWINHMYDLRRMFGRKGGYLPNLISWYGAAPYGDRIFLISFAGKYLCRLNFNSRYRGLSPLQK